MSGHQPPSPSHPRGNWTRSSSSPIYYRPPSPWAPSPPPIISGARRPSLNSPVPVQMISSPMSPGIVNSRPVPFSPIPFSPGGGQSNLRGTRGSPATHSRLRSPQPKPYQYDLQQQQQQQQMQQKGGLPPQPSYYNNMVCPSPLTIGGVNGPRPYQPPSSQIPSHSFSPVPGPKSSFQLSPTPSPIVFQSPTEYVYNHNASYEPSRQPQYEYVGVPLEPPQPKSYIIYDDEYEQGPTTAEIIANQSQDYVDEKLAEYQMTILALQGK